MGGLTMVSKPLKQPKVQILKYHGNSFITGLLWHSLDSPTAYMREARQFGRREEMDIVAIRATPSIIQAGFVARSDGAVKGMYSLAASLAGQLGDSWVAAWRVATDEDRYALVAVHQGAVLPGCDQVGSAEDTHKKVAQLLGSTIAFKHLYLPKEFNRGGEDLDVASLLQPKNLKRQYRLRHLAFGLSKDEWIRVGLAGAVIGAGLFGWHQWDLHQKNLAIAAAKQRQVELDALNARSGLEQTAKALEHPWAKRPGLEDFISGCNGGINTLPLSIEGWVFDSAKCDGEKIISTYKRTENSTASGLIEAVKNHFADEPAFFDAGNTATLLVTLNLSFAGDEQLLDASTALPQMMSWLHGQGLSPSLREVPVVVPQQAPLPGGGEPPPPPPPEWKHFEITYHGPLPPAIVLKDAPNTGVRLQVVAAELRADKLVWSVTGDLYAK